MTSEQRIVNAAIAYVFKYASGTSDESKELWHAVHNYLHEHTRRYQDCSACLGKGMISSDYGFDTSFVDLTDAMTCPNCGGDGKLPV